MIKEVNGATTRDAMMAVAIVEMKAMAVEDKGREEKDMENKHEIILDTQIIP